ncbi:MAG: hypothetical protein CR982_06155 [Candidatus Cloacimonadota bacterium]|nr:MAG: hypothetical protein CR982_06155 [Candidatus Cloacimonadota bacterium]PIE78103.1 MAG: hypothetical protein CSA15_09715 [Candidatus Delongbacteria bacterium]
MARKKVGSKKKVQKSKRGKKRSKSSIFSLNKILILIFVAIVILFLINIDKLGIFKGDDSPIDMDNIVKIKKRDTFSKDIDREVKKDYEVNEKDLDKSIERFEKYQKLITDYSKKYLGISYKLGGDPDKEKGTDNSHLIYAIIKNSAQESGYGFPNYQPIKSLLKNCSKISISDIRNGDLIVAKGYPALVYNIEKKDGFDIIYLSSKKRKVVSEESEKLSSYWFNNKYFEGIYRLNDDLFERR